MLLSSAVRTAVRSSTWTTSTGLSTICNKTGKKNRLLLHSELSSYAFLKSNKKCF